MCASSRVPLSSLRLGCWRLNDSDALFQSIGLPSQRILSILYSPHGTSWPSSLPFDLPISLAHPPPQIDSPPSFLSSLALAISPYPTHLQSPKLLNSRDFTAWLNIIRSTYTPPHWSTPGASSCQTVSHASRTLDLGNGVFFLFSFFSLGRDGVLFFFPSFHLTTFSINLIRHLHLFLSYFFCEMYSITGPVYALPLRLRKSICRFFLDSTHTSALI
jgi:hypothetical protein